MIYVLNMIYVLKCNYAIKNKCFFLCGRLRPRRSYRTRELILFFFRYKQGPGLVCSDILDIWCPCLTFDSHKFFYLMMDEISTYSPFPCHEAWVLSERVFTDANRKSACSKYNQNSHIQSDAEKSQWNHFLLKKCCFLVKFNYILKYMYISLTTQKFLIYFLTTGC